MPLQEFIGPLGRAHFISLRSLNPDEWPGGPDIAVDLLRAVDSLELNIVMDRKTGDSSQRLGPNLMKVDPKSERRYELASMMRG
jgi:hypothetical protein